MDATESQMERWRARNAKRIVRRENKARALEEWRASLDRVFGVRPERGAYASIFNAGNGKCPF